MLVTETTASNVRAELARKDMTQSQAALKLGISKQAMSSKLNNKTAFTLLELVCFLDYFFCVFAGLVDSADAFCSFFVHGGSFRVGRTAVVGERENPKYGIGG